MLRHIETVLGRRASLKCLLHQSLRQKGWVVHGGLNYGVDFILYEGSPEEEHARYSLLMKDRNDSCSWREAVAVNRVATTARKKLVIAFVSGSDPSTFSAHFVQVNRWVPENDRNPFPNQ